MPDLNREDQRRVEDTAVALQHIASKLGRTGWLVLKAEIDAQEDAVEIWNWLGELEHEETRGED